MLKLQELKQIPEGLLELEKVSDLHTIISQPTLIHLDGVIKEPLFISVLLHANEDTGFFAIQSLLRRYQNHPLPRSILLFFGNIEASKKGVRHLDSQPDYNRVWPGHDLPESKETCLMQAVIDKVSTQKPFASIDIHNNTGKNPHYGCINKLTPECLHLASLFSPIVVFFETPKGIQTIAMSKLCPAVTIECGKPGEKNGIEHATDFLVKILHLKTLEAHHKLEIDVFHTVARVTVPKRNSFSFSNESQAIEEGKPDIIFAKDIDHINFTKLPKNTVLAKIKPESNARLIAWDDHKQDVSNIYFSMNGENLILAKSLMPAMLTLDKKIVRQDCLCYLMENIDV